MTPLSHKQQLEFAAQVLETEIFGAFWLALEARRTEKSLTQAQLAERTCRDKTNISKLLDGPRNWTIRTISDLAEGLDLKVEFCLGDKLNWDRKFTPTGVSIGIQSPQIYGGSYLLDSNVLLNIAGEVALANAVGLPAIQNMYGASFQLPPPRQQPMMGSMVSGRASL